jgi:hypothetical protein
MTIESEPGQGSIFSVFLPVYDDITTAAAEKKDAHGAAL